jgi:hypothetical protein
MLLKCSLTFTSRDGAAAHVRHMRHGARSA